MNSDIIAVFAKKEAVEGVAEALVTTDAIPTIGADIQYYEGDRQKRNLDKSAKGADTEVNTDPHNIIKFGVEAMAEGTAATPSKQSDLMLACGWNRVIDSTPSSETVTMSLISGNGDSLTVAHKQLQDDDQHMTFVSTGCRGSMSGKFAKGQNPEFTFEFKGKYHTPTEEVVVAKDTTAWKDGLPVSTENTLVADLDGFAVCFEQFNFNTGVEVNRPKLVGCDATTLGNRNTTGNIVVKAYDLNVKNYFTKMESHNGVQTIPFNMVHGTVQYSIIEADIQKLQINSVKRTEIDGMLAWDIAWTAPTDDANLVEMTLIER